MNSKGSPGAAIVFVVLCQYAANAHAAAPESCFKSQHDYLVYLKYGDKAPLKNSEWLEEFIGTKEYTELKNDRLYGPARRKEIVIHTEATYDPATKMITLDASRSTTPSGQIAFAWGDPAAPISTDSRVSSKGSPGSTNVVPLRVSDPVCESRASKNVSSNAQ